MTKQKQPLIHLYIWLLYMSFCFFYFPPPTVEVSLNVFKVPDTFTTASSKNLFDFRWFPMPEEDPRGGLPGHAHPQCDDRGMDGSEGQLLKLVSFVLSWKWPIAFPVEVHLQVGNVADTRAGLWQSGPIHIRRVIIKTAKDNEKKKGQQSYGEGDCRLDHFHGGKVQQHKTTLIGRREQDFSLQVSILSIHRALVSVWTFTQFLYRTHA